MRQNAGQNHEVENHENAPVRQFKGRWRKIFPALAFVGGFVWDSLTMGRVVQSSDLWALSGYYLAAFAALYWIGTGPREPWLSRLTWIVQFCFGSLFSALVIFYFKSSGNSWTLGFVAVFVLLLIGNEFLQTRYSRVSFAWTLFTLSGAMFLNFFLPHMVHGVGFFWFLLSTLIAFVMTCVLWKFSERPFWYLLFPFGVVGLLIAAYIGEIIPPVPMVLKQNLVCKEFARIEGEYTCLEPEQNWLARAGLMPYRIHAAPEEKIYVLSAVFGPSGIEAELEHRWQYLDTVSGTWQYRGTVSFRMVGGRSSGWRLYSNKQGLTPGLWRVQTALRDGAAMGFVQFEVPEEAEADGAPYQRRVLR